jgi:hypothetical protein
MKKICFLFTLLASITASATVTVAPLGVDYNTKTVKFSVSWTGVAANNRVWVWIDLCPVAGTTAGTFAKAVISNPSTITGSIVTVTGNTRGFYVTSNPSTVTATLSNATGKFNWYAYGSDYPPNAVDNAGGGYDLRGTPPVIINGTIEMNATTYSGSEITALTDATGCPGALCGKNGEAPGLLNCCAYGTTNCSGTCKTNGTYTKNDGSCTGDCHLAYVRQYNQCDAIISSNYSTYQNTSCKSYSNFCRECIKYCNTYGYTYSYQWTLGANRCYCTKSNYTDGAWHYVATRYAELSSSCVWTLIGESASANCKFSDLIRCY